MRLRFLCLTTPAFLSFTESESSGERRLGPGSKSGKEEKEGGNDEKDISVELWFKLKSERVT